MTRVAADGLLLILNSKGGGDRMHACLLINVDVTLKF